MENTKVGAVNRAATCLQSAQRGPVARHSRKGEAWERKRTYWESLMLLCMRRRTRAVIGPSSVEIIFPSIANRNGSRT